MLNDSWQTNAERLWRSFEKLREVIEDTAVNDRIDATEVLRQFCRYAFELQEWLLRSAIDQSAKDAITALFGKPSKKPSKRVQGTSQALTACADIANAIKHFELDRGSYSIGGYAEIVAEEMSSASDIPEVFREQVGDVPRFGDHQWHWWIRIDGQDHDALMLAERAIDDWTECLESVGLVQAYPGGWLFLERGSGSP